MHAGSTDVRDRIVEAAASIVTTKGWHKLTYTKVASLAGVSRPTVYAHFPTREDLIGPVETTVTVAITNRVIAQTETARTAAEFVVETVAALVLEFRAEPTGSALTLLQPPGMLAPAGIELAAGFLQPLVDREPHLAPEIAEIAETMTRFMISFVMYDSEATRSPDALRAYLHRRLVPALGLQPRAGDPTS